MAERFSGSQWRPASVLSVLSSLLMLPGALLLTVAGIVLWQSASPAVCGGLRLF